MHLPLGCVQCAENESAGNHPRAAEPSCAEACAILKPESRFIQHGRWMVAVLPPTSRKVSSALNAAATHPWLQIHCKVKALVKKLEGAVECSFESAQLKAVHDLVVPFERDLMQ